MLDREKALSIIDQAYADRIRGDKDAVSRYWREDGTFRLVADERPLTAALDGDAETVVTVAGLMDNFEMRDLKRIDAVFEGHKLALRWQATVSSARHEPITTEFTDFVEFDDEGRIRSFVQHCDTAMMVHMLR